jgi:hypothetical protein
MTQANKSVGRAIGCYRIPQPALGPGDCGTASQVLVRSARSPIAVGDMGVESQSNMRHQRRIQIPLPQEGKERSTDIAYRRIITTATNSKIVDARLPGLFGQFSKMLARKVDNECFKSPLDRDCSTHRQVDNTNRPLGVQPDRGCWSAVPDVSMLYINKIKHDEKCVVGGNYDSAIPLAVVGDDVGNRRLGFPERSGNKSWSPYRPKPLPHSVGDYVCFTHNGLVINVAGTSMITSRLRIRIAGSIGHCGAQSDIKIVRNNLWEVMKAEILVDVVKMEGSVFAKKIHHAFG